MNKFIKYFIFSMIVEIAVLMGMAWYQQALVKNKKDEKSVQKSEQLTPVSVKSPLKSSLVRDNRMETIEKGAQKASISFNIPVETAYLSDYGKIPPAYTKIKGPISEITSTLPLPIADLGQASVGGKITYPYDGGFGYDHLTNKYSVPDVASSSYPFSTASGKTAPMRHATAVRSPTTSNASSASEPVSFTSATPNSDQKNIGYGFAKPNINTGKSVSASVVHGPTRSNKPKVRDLDQDAHQLPDQGQGFESKPKKDIVLEPKAPYNAKLRSAEQKLIPKEMLPKERPRFIPKNMPTFIPYNFSGIRIPNRTAWYRPSVVPTVKTTAPQPQETFIFSDDENQPVLKLFNNEYVATANNNEDDSNQTQLLGAAGLGVAGLAGAATMYSNSESSQPKQPTNDLTNLEIEPMESEGGVGSRPLPVEREEIVEPLILELQPEIIEMPPLENIVTPQDVSVLPQQEQIVKEIDSGLEPSVVTQPVQAQPNVESERIPIMQESVQEITLDIPEKTKTVQSQNIWKKYKDSAKTARFEYPKIAKTVPSPAKKIKGKEAVVSKNKWPTYVEPESQFQHKKSYPILPKIEGQEIVAAKHAMEPVSKLPTQQRNQYLQILGFEPETMPTLREITRRARVRALDYHPDKVTGENEKLLKILQARDALLNDFDKSQDAQPVLLLEETVRPEIERMESEGGVGSRPLPVEREEIAELLTLELQPEVIEMPSLSKELLVFSPEKDVVIHSELKKELQPFVSPKQSIIVTKEAVLPQQPKIISSMKSTEEHIVTPDKGIDDREFRDRMKQKISGYKPSEFVETSTESNFQLSKQTQLPKKAAQRAKEKIKFGSEGIDIVKKASQITQPVAKTQVKIIQGSGMASMLKKPKIPKMPLDVVLQSNPELKEDMEIRKYAAQAGGMIMQPTAEELAVERQRQLEQLLAYQEQQKQMQEQIAMQEPIQDWLVKYPQSLQPPDIAAGLSPTVSETASLGALAKYIERLKLRK